MNGSPDALEELRAALTRRGNVKLLTLLAAAEGKLGCGSIVRRRTIHGATLERLSPEGYWADGSMRCPFEEHLGHVACDYHTFSGCSNDPDDAEETAQIMASMRDAARRQAEFDADAGHAADDAPGAPG
jgi:hypothetical protein